MTLINLDSKTVKRLPIYLQYLKNLQDDNIQEISSKRISTDLRMNFETVQNDMTQICPSEKSTSSFSKLMLIQKIRMFTNSREISPVIVIGAGRLGRALLGYSGFLAYDLDVVAAFDVNPKTLSKKDASGKPIYHFKELNHVCTQIKAKIGIIAVPADSAHHVCDMMIEAGIRVIWNFSTANITSSKETIIKNQNLTMTLVQLAKQIRD